MEAANQQPAAFDEKQSLQVIKEMIQVSRKKLRNDGILFILWGWTMFYSYINNYIQRTFILTFQVKDILGYAGYALGIFTVVFTIYHVVKQRKKVQTYIGISLRYVWVSVFFCQVLINLIQGNVLHNINFELQHPIFMVVIAFAIVVTGGILRYKLLVAGGVVFGMLAYISSFLALREQLLVEAIAWLIAFIVPGHILYSKRKSH